MGAIYVAECVTGPSPDEALSAMLENLTEGAVDDEGNPDWPHPFGKGYVQVWDKPVTDDAIEWMRGWIQQNPPTDVDPDDRWGPWLMFPLARGGWCFFGWVNT